MGDLHATRFKRNEVYNKKASIAFDHGSSRAELSFIQTTLLRSTCLLFLTCHKTFDSDLWRWSGWLKSICSLSIYTKELDY